MHLNELLKCSVETLSVNQLKAAKTFLTVVVIKRFCQFKILIKHVYYRLERTNFIQRKNQLDNIHK